MRRSLSVLAAVGLALQTNAAGAGGSPFAPPAKPQPKVVRLLAPPGLSSAGALQAFEQESGIAVAYDAYGDPDRIPAMLKDGPYDVAILPGPQLARAAAAGKLRRVERARVPNAKAIAAPVAAKLAAYDPGFYALAWGWTPTGLVYDSGKVSALLGATPNAWTAALAPNVAGKLTPCGVALPDSPDDLFIAAWRLMGVDPSRTTERAVTGAADLIIAARQSARMPDSRDPVGALAGGAACLAFGGPLQAEAAARRSREGGGGLDIRYAAPREGGPVAIAALAEPRDAAHPIEAAALIDFLLRPAVAAQATAAAGLLSAEAVGPNDNFRALWPVGVYEPRIAATVEKEWARVLHPAASQPAGAKAAAGKSNAGKPSGGKAAGKKADAKSSAGAKAAAPKGKTRSESKSKP